MLQNERVFVVDTITGDRLAEIAVTAFSYKRVMNQEGSGSATVMLGDSRNDGLDLRSLLRSVRRSLVYEGNFGAVYFGIITRTTYNRADQSLTIEHKDLWWMMARRMAVDHGPNNAEKTVLNYGPTSFRTIIKRLLQEVMFPSRSWYALPILLPPDEAGTVSRTYYGYNFATVADAIRDLIEADGGPNVDFQPSWNGEQVQLELRAGSLTGSIWDYTLDAPEPGIYDVQRVEDAESTTTNAYSLGEGTEKNMLVRSEPNLDPTMPAIEKTESYKDISKPAELSALALGRIRSQAGSTVQVSASIRKDGEPGPNGGFVTGLPTVDQLRLGDTFTLNSFSDPWLPTGKTNYQLIEFSGALGDPMVKLQFQETGA